MTYMAEQTLIYRETVSISEAKRSPESFKGLAAVPNRQCVA